MIVVIDPGHGGDSNIGGSSSNNAMGPGGTKEKNLTLDVAKLVFDGLKLAEHDAMLTRFEDKNLGLAARAEIAKENSADIFVSIHFNGFEDPTVQGVECWVSETHSSNSKLIADSVLDRIVAATGYSNRGIKIKDWGVLLPSRHLSKTAACLIEISFLTNPEEELRLKDNQYKKKLADALIIGISDFGQQVSTDLIS